MTWWKIILCEIEVREQYWTSCTCEGYFLLRNILVLSAVKIIHLNIQSVLLISRVLAMTPLKLTYPLSISERTFRFLKHSYCGRTCFERANSCSLIVVWLAACVGRGKPRCLLEICLSTVIETLNFREKSFGKPIVGFGVENVTWEGLVGS